MNELITRLASPYDGENHYGEQNNWSVRIILLIRKLHEIGILDQNKVIISNLKKFLSDKDSVRDNLVELWSDTLIFIGCPVEEIVESIRPTYNDNPTRPNIARALSTVLKKYPNHFEIVEMIREVCRHYIESAYSHDYKVFIETQKGLNIDLGLKDVFLSELKTKPWYDMIDLFAYLDLQALRKVTQISYDRIERSIREQEPKEDSILLQLIMRNISALTC